MDGVRPVPPELEVTSAELQHIKANVYDHCVVCLPSAYVRAVPGLNLNVSGGYHADRTDTRVSDERTLWVGRLGELGAALGKFKEEEKKEESTSETEPSTGETTESTKRVGDGVAALLALSELELLEPSDTGSHATPSEKDEISPTPKPAVVFVSGSSGVAGDTLRYLRMIASEGHLVLCPDDFCGWPKRLRHRTPKAIKQWVEVDGEDKQTDDDKKQSQPSSDYWSLNLLYSANETPTGELVYESCAEQYTSSDRLAMVYDTTLAVKHLALTKLLLDLPKSIATRGIYLAGNSEGAIVLGMMDDSMLDAPVNGGSRRRSVGDLIASAGTGTSAFAGLLQGLSGLRLLTGDTAWEAKLLGRINIAYSLEPNYFTYRTIKKTTESDRLSDSMGDLSQANSRNVPSRSNNSSPAPPPRGLFGSRWRKDVPTLCVNGSADQFFGRRNSVSEKVIHKSSDELVKKGDRPNITGDAGQRIAELGMTRAFVVQMEGAKHAMCATHDSALREVLRAFLDDPEQCVGIPERWEAEDESLATEKFERTVLWHSVVTPGKCSFAAIAATEVRGGKTSSRHSVDMSRALSRRTPRNSENSALKNGSDKKITEPEKIEELPEVMSRSSSRTEMSEGNSSRGTSLHGSRSFLDLTSSLARLVRPASWNLPGSPLIAHSPSRGAKAESPAKSDAVDDTAEVVGQENNDSQLSDNLEPASPKKPTNLFGRFEKWVRKKTGKKS